MNSFKCAENLSWKDIGDHIVILDSQNKQMVHHLEEVAALIWKSLSVGKSEDSIIQEICSQYDTTEENAKADFDNFIDNLKSQDLLENK